MFYFLIKILRIWYSVERDSATGLNCFVILHFIRVKHLQDIEKKNNKIHQFTILKIKAYDKQIKSKKFIKMNIYFIIEMNLDVKYNFPKQINLLN